MDVGSFTPYRDVQDLHVEYGSSLCLFFGPPLEPSCKGHELAVYQSSGFSSVERLGSGVLTAVEVVVESFDTTVWVGGRAAQRDQDDEVGWRFHSASSTEGRPANRSCSSCGRPTAHRSERLVAIGNLPDVAIPGTRAITN